MEALSLQASRGQELQGTARTHGSLLHELRDIYKHLRVELKDGRMATGWDQAQDDICDLVEQIKAAPRETKDKERALRPGLSGNLSPPRSHEPSPARSREPSGREDWPPGGRGRVCDPSCLGRCPISRMSGWPKMWRKSSWLPHRWLGGLGRRKR